MSRREFLLDDGRRLAFVDAGSGEALVLVHGWSMSAAVFGEVLPELARSFRVLAPDLRGHGHSQPGPGYRLEELSADLAEWLDGCGLKRVRLLGWSLGGQVALRLALARPARVERLVLVASTPRFCASPAWTGGLAETQVRAMARDLRRHYLKAQGEFFERMFSGEELTQQRRRAILEVAVRQGRLPAPEVALAALETLRAADLRAELPAVACPVLVQHGERDVITPPEAGRFLAQAIPGARLELWANVGHGPFLSRPAASVALWREFLA